MQSKEQTAEAVAPAEESAPDREQQEARLQEVNAILRRAFNGEKLPKDEFQKLKDGRQNSALSLATNKKRPEPKSESGGAYG